MIGAPLWRQPYANDPALFVDDDGRAYLYSRTSGVNYLVAEMADDMRGLKGGRGLGTLRQWAAL